MAENNTTSNNQQQEKTARNIFRTRKTTHFVTISTIPLYDKSLSLKAKGLWAFGMAHPNDWTFHLSELETHCSEGKRAIYNAFNELIEHGYAARFAYKEKRENSNLWVFAGNEYVFFESKQTPQQISEVKEEFKKCFSQRCFVDAHFEDPQNSTLLEHDGLIEHDSLEEYAPPCGDANQAPSSLSDAPKKTPKVPFRSVCLTERMPNHPSLEKFKKSFNIPLVGIDEKDHEALVAKYGESVISAAYTQLAEWKLSKAEMQPKAVTMHTDLHRLKKWVIKEVQANPPAVQGLGSHRKWAIGIDKSPIDPVEKRRYAWGTKGEEREQQLIDYLKKVKKSEQRLGKMSNEMVDSLEREMLEYIEKQGVGNELGSL